MTAPLLPPDNPVTLREIVQEAQSELLQWDRGFVGTALWLVRQPALVIRSYLWQRSPRFVKPLRYLLSCVAISLLMSWLIHTKFGLRTPWAPTGEFDNFLIENTAILQLILLPLMAVLLRLAFHGLQLRYVDALVTLAYTQAQVNLAGALLLSLVAVLPGDSHVVGGFSLVMVLYTLWIWFSVASGPRWRRALAAVVALVLSQLLNSGFVLLLQRLPGLTGA